MNEQKTHRLYRHFQELPLSMRVLFTGALLAIGLGYLFALIYVYQTDSGKDGNPGLSVNDIVISYSGSSEGTRLETAMRGSMSSMLPPDERSEILAWIHGGALKGVYETDIQPLLEKNCLDCHDGSNPHLANLDGWDNIQVVVDHDSGTPLNQLVRVSHIHLFGVVFIFFIMGFIFSHAYVRPVWFKSLVILTPFICIVADVMSWYFTKLYAGFAYVVMAAGAMMALCFAIMWFTAMWQMWFYKRPGFLVRDDVDGAET